MLLLSGAKHSPQAWALRGLPTANHHLYTFSRHAVLDQFQALCLSGSLMATVYVKFGIEISGVGAHRGDTHV